MKFPPPEGGHVLTIRLTAAEHQAAKDAAHEDHVSLNEFCRAVLAGATSEFWKCRVCGCTELNCEQCVEKTGEPCYWIAPNLCSACVETPPPLLDKLLEPAKLEDR